LSSLHFDLIFNDASNDEFPMDPDDEEGPDANGDRQDGDETMGDAEAEYIVTDRVEFDSDDESENNSKVDNDKDKGQGGRPEQSATDTA
jgi:hypothetical protein